MPIPSIESLAINRDALLARYRGNRDRSRRLFDLLTEDAYYSRPIELRHPIVFYEGHLPAFSFNTLVKKALGGPSIDPRLETLFARGIDPHDSSVGSASNGPQWPDRAVVEQFAAEADRRGLAAPPRAGNQRPRPPPPPRAPAGVTPPAHQALPHETLLDLWPRPPPRPKRPPAG